MFEGSEIQKHHHSSTRRPSREREKNENGGEKKKFPISNEASANTRPLQEAQCEYMSPRLASTAVNICDSVLMA